MSPYLRRIDTLAIGDECFNFAARLANRFKVENASNQCLGCSRALSGPELWMQIIASNYTEMTSYLVYEELVLKMHTIMTYAIIAYKHYTDVYNYSFCNLLSAADLLVAPYLQGAPAIIGLRRQL